MEQSARSPAGSDGRGDEDRAGALRPEPLLEEMAEVALEVEIEIEQEREPGGPPTIAIAKRHLVIRAARVGAGSGLVVAGVILLVLPGPGWLTIAAGLLLLREDVPFVRRLETRVRARLPVDEQEHVDRRVVVLSLAVAAASLVFSVWWMFLR